MNEIGLHAMTCVTSWSVESMKRAVHKTAEHGFDFIETVILDPRDTKAEETAREIEKANLRCVTGMSLNTGADISSPDGEVRKKGEKYIHESLCAARDMGSTLLTGVTHSAMFRYPHAMPKGTRERVVESYARLAKIAEDAQVKLGVEAVNRYESNVVNTVDDAAAIVAAVESPWLVVHIDSYHMNIEEHDIESTISRNRRYLGYVHVGESHRGFLGTGSIDFRRFFYALVRSNYSGQIGFEAFSRAILNDASGDNLATWRSDWSSSDEIARHGLAFIRDYLESAERAILADQ